MMMMMMIYAIYAVKFRFYALLLLFMFDCYYVVGQCSAARWPIVAAQIRYVSKLQLTDC